MKIEISIEKDDSEKEQEQEMGKSKGLTALQMKVAKLLAKNAGRKKPNQMDMEKASEIEDEEESDA